MIHTFSWEYRLGYFSRDHIYLSYDFHIFISFDMIFYFFLSVLISLLWLLLARELCALFVWIYMRLHDPTWTERLFMSSSHPLMRFYQFSTISFMAPFAKHWNRQTLIFCLIKLYFYPIGLDGINSVCPFQQCWSLKHSFGFARLRQSCCLMLEPFRLSLMHA